MLIPISTLEEDKEVIDRALELGNRLKSNLTFLHVNKGRLIKAGAGLEFMEKPKDDGFSKEEILNYIHEEKVRKKVHVEVETLEHIDIGLAISENVLKFELLVVGHKKSNIFDRILGGHTLQKVINSVNCDVYVVNQKGR